jgi:hypothetical protein
MWSLTKLDFLFYDFSVIYYDFFKDSAEINKKEKDKTVFKTAYNRVTEVKRTVLRVEGLPDFGVQGEKTDFNKS